MNIHIKYVHPTFNIGMEDVRNVWLLEPDPVKLTTATHHGSLVYRMPRAGKRNSYHYLKKGLVKKKFVIKRPLQLLPF